MPEDPESNSAKGTYFSFVPLAKIEYTDKAYHIISGYP